MAVTTPTRRVPSTTLALALALALGVVAAHAQRYVPTSDADHPRLRFPDSLLSMNDRCIVSQSKLNTRVRPIYVNGDPVGFC